MKTCFKELFYFYYFKTTFTFPSGVRVECPPPLAKYLLISPTMKNASPKKFFTPTEYYFSCYNSIKTLLVLVMASVVFLTSYALYIVQVMLILILIVAFSFGKCLNGQNY